MPTTLRASDLRILDPVPACNTCVTGAHLQLVGSCQLATGLGHVKGLLWSRVAGRNTLLGTDQKAIPSHGALPLRAAGALYRPEFSDAAQLLILYSWQLLRILLKHHYTMGTTAWCTGGPTQGLRRGSEAKDDRR